MTDLLYNRPMTRVPPHADNLLVVPQKRPQIVPTLGIAIQVCHRVEHPGLNGLAMFVEEVHHCTPTDSRKDREGAGVGRRQPYRPCGA